MSIEYKIGKPYPGFLSQSINDVVTQTVDAGLAEAREAFERQAKLDWPVNTGDTRRQIRSYRLRVLEHYIEAGHPASIVIEEGRRPGKRMPPIAVIRLYCQQKGIDPGAAYPIARAIGRRGIPGRFVFKKTASSVFPTIPSILERHGNEIGLKLR